MRSNRFIAFLALAAALAGAPLSLGCGFPGERAATGTCPAGEICSPATPSGLVFEGRAIGGSFAGGFLGGGIAPTAVGGTQRIEFRLADARESFPPSRAETADGSVLAVASSEGRSVSLAAAAAGETLLRVVEIDGGELLDRVRVHAMPIFEARLDPMDLVVALAPEPAPVVALAGETNLFVHLAAGDGTLLVDDSMVLGAGTGEYTVDGRDGIAVAEPSDAFGLDVIAGGLALHAEATIVDGIDDLVVADWLVGHEEAGVTVLDAGSLFCVVAMAGEARVVGGPGATFVVDGTMLPREEGQMTNCTSLPTRLGASTTIVVSLLGVSRSFTFRVGDRDATVSPLLSSAPLTFADLRPRARMLGDRALASPF